MLERILPPSIEPHAAARAALRGRAPYRALLRAVPLPAEPADAHRGQVDHHRRAHGLAHAGQGQHGRADEGDDGQRGGADRPGDGGARPPTCKSTGRRKWIPAHPALKSEPERCSASPARSAMRCPIPAATPRASGRRVVERMKRHMAWANTVVGPDVAEDHAGARHGGDRAFPAALRACRSEGKISRRWTPMNADKNWSAEQINFPLSCGGEGEVGAPQSFTVHCSPFTDL